jgi:tetratricopeptide (TPR) repeat protein
LVSKAHFDHFNLEDMKKKTNITISGLLALLLLILVTGSCKKYLDEKPNRSYDIPGSLADLQALLDYYPTMNTKDPASAEISADNYFISDDDFDGLATESYRRMYTWQKDHVFDPQFNDWANAYKVVYVANLVLDQINNMPKTDAHAWDNIKGQALVFRAKAFLQIADVWSPAYNSASAASDLGIPLRINSNSEEKTVRATTKETFDQIISDLKQAASLLPVKQVTALRPSKAAAYGFIARTYLQMGVYDQAGLYADSCLRLQNTLLDFNTLAPTARFPIAKLNSEVIFESSMPNGGPIASAVALIDSTLVPQYDSNDLRKKIFFKSLGGSFSFKGSYEGSSTLFSGLAVDEMYLTRAECEARTGNKDAAIGDLNTLLQARYDGTFSGRTASDASDALNQILTERRKELLMRGLRWPDLKRLNKDGANISINRLVHGTEYTLPPNDPRYSLPIPEDVIALTGIQQNPR